MTVTEEYIRGLEDYKGPITSATLDFIYAERVRGFKYRTPAENPVHVDTWEEPGKPDKLLSPSQLQGRWTGSIEACLAELDYMSHKIPGYSVELYQDNGEPTSVRFQCVVKSGDTVLSSFSEGAFSLAILKCALELVLFHKFK